MEATRTEGALPEHCVTASQLVRNFGVWQDHATRHPVYIMHRGRPRLAIASIDILEALCAPGIGRTEWMAERDVLLDAIDDIVVLLDRNDRVIVANHAARAFLKITADRARGQLLAAIAPAALAMFLESTVRRVCDTGITERLEIGSGVARMGLTVAPLASGTAIIARDLSCRDALETAQSALDAVDTALAEIEGVAKVRVNTRGHIVHPTRSFIRITGLPEATLAAVRFVSLIEVGSRVAVAEAVERVIRQDRPCAIDARLLVNGRSPLPVRIGLSPLDRRLTVDGVEAVIVAGGAP